MASFDSGKLCIYYLTKTGVVDVRMVDDNVATCVAAAETLGARFFVKAIDFDITEDVPVWGVFDVSRPVFRVIQNALSVVKIPNKEFRTETIDAPIMWARTMEAIG